MKELKDYQEEKGTKSSEVASETSIVKMRQIMSAQKENYGFVVLRERADHRFLDRPQEKVNTNAVIRRGVEVAYRKDNKGQLHFTYNEGYFIADKKSTIYGKITIDKNKVLRADVLFDAVKAGDIVDLGEKGAFSSYNTEETLYYTDKKSFTNFFANVEISSENADASEL